MIRLYFSQGPNPTKVALMLEEISIPYEVARIDLYSGEQLNPEFRKLNPNGKLPVIIDVNDDTLEEVVVFDSNAILLYLAEKTGMLLGEPKERPSILSWLMFIGTGLGPFSGQFAHFQHYATEKIPYAIHRYRSELDRHLDVLDERLAKHAYIASESYSIVDVDAWGWLDMIPLILPNNEDAFSARPNLNRWYQAVGERPAIGRARRLLRDFKARLVIDEAARRALYPFQFTEPKQ